MNGTPKEITAIDSDQDPKTENLEVTWKILVSLK
jgi:hypothetical protein